MDRSIGHLNVVDALGASANAACRSYVLGRKLVITKANTANDSGGDGTIETRSRLGGILNFYHRETA